jgi:DNA replication protein DnaC
VIRNLQPVRALRGAAIGRRNYLFAGAHSGGERAAEIYSLISTAKLNNVDPEAWLRFSTDRAVRSVSHQMNAAKFPVHRDLAGFDFDGSPADRQLVMQLAGMTFTEGEHNLVLVGGPGSGKSHLATAIGVSGIKHHGKRVPFYSAVDLANALDQEKAQGLWCKRNGLESSACTN